MIHDTSLNIVTASTGNEQLNYSVTLSSGEQSVILTLNDFNKKYYELVRNEIGPILNIIISNLIRSRDYMGLQLNLEFGNISEKEYEQLELDFLTEQKELDPIELKTDVEMLIKLLNKTFNVEEISTMFNCSIESAEKAMNILLIEKE
jgi:hypothetical protein